MSLSARLVQNHASLFAASAETETLRLINRCSGNRAMPAAVPAASLVVTLETSHTAALKTRGPVTIRCLSGLLWMTRSGHIQDTVLQAGQQQVVLQSSRDIVLSNAASLQPVTVEIVPAPGKHEHRWWPLRRAQSGFQLDIH
jgi:hypothetical protein